MSRFAVNAADRNFKGPFYTLRHVRDRLKRDTRVLERGLGSVSGIRGFARHWDMTVLSEPQRLEARILQRPRQDRGRQVLGRVHRAKTQMHVSFLPAGRRRFRAHVSALILVHSRSKRPRDSPNASGRYFPSLRGPPVAHKSRLVMRRLREHAYVRTPVLRTIREVRRRRCEGRASRCPGPR